MLWLLSFAPHTCTESKKIATVNLGAMEFCGLHRKFPAHKLNAVYNNFLHSTTRSLRPPAAKFLQRMQAFFALHVVGSMLLNWFPAAICEIKTRERIKSGELTERAAPHEAPGWVGLQRTRWLWAARGRGQVQTNAEWLQFNSGRYKTKSVLFVIINNSLRTKYTI